MIVKTKMVSLVMILLAVIIGFWLIRFKPEKEPKELVAKFSWQGKKEMNKELLELKRVGKGLGIPSFWPRGLAIREKYLYASEYWSHCLQIFRINPDGSLTPKFLFGKRGEGLGEFDIPNDLVIKGNYLYVSDAGNDRIQVLEIKY